jgi:uncharacterized protein (TIGR02145 family)
MKKAKAIITISGVLILFISYGNISENSDHSGGLISDQANSSSAQTSTKSVQTNTKSAQSSTKSTQTKSKSVQKSAKPVQKSTKPAQKSTKPAPIDKSKDVGIIRIGPQAWAIANLNVSTFRNGDTIPEAKTNKDWVAAGEAGKPAWCYYNNDPAIGLIYGKLYNWYAVNDPRGLAPAGWILPGDADWGKLISSLGGVGTAGLKMKSNKRWSDDNNGTNDSGFTGFPGGYRAENGAFLNIGSIGIWWSSSESNLLNAIDHYLSQSNSMTGSTSPKKRGESVRCLRD